MLLVTEEKLKSNNKEIQMTKAKCPFLTLKSSQQCIAGSLNETRSIGARIIISNHAHHSTIHQSSLSSPK